MSSRKTYYLLVKCHNKTGLKYLCKHTTHDLKSCFNYLGSGLRWKKHLKTHGTELSTTILFKTTNKKIFKKVALYISKEFNVVENPNWANLCPENGWGGKTWSGEYPIAAREKLSCLFKGKPKSEIARKNMSLNHANVLGMNNPMFNRKHTNTTKLKISKKNKGKLSPFKGRHHTESSKQKQSQQMKGKFVGSKNPRWKGGISVNYKRSHTP